MAGTFFPAHKLGRTFTQTEVPALRIRFLETGSDEFVFLGFGFEGFVDDDVGVLDHVGAHGLQGDEGVAQA